MFTFVYKRSFNGVLLALPAAPLLWSLLGAAQAGLDMQSWRAALQSPGLLQAAMLSLWTGMASTLLALGLSAAIALQAYRSQPPATTGLSTRWLAAMLSMPHAAFAIGVVALITPGGWLLRLMSPWATGLNSPPDWSTTQDPWGLGLIAVLTLKETPYLLWMVAAVLQQPDVAARLRKEYSLACTLGYTHAQVWWRVVWPQLLDKLKLPCLAVLAYGLGTVDVALVIGPSSPPTLAVWAWQWLQDADPATNAQGATAAWLLLGLTVLCACVLLAWNRLPVWQRLRTRGATTRLSTARTWMTNRMTDGIADRVTTRLNKALPMVMALALPLSYVLVLAALGLGSVVGVWPFPDLLPHSWTTAAWQSVWESRDVLAVTLGLALASAGTALLWSVAWLECGPSGWLRTTSVLLYLPLALPPVLWVLGLHRMGIYWDVDGTYRGLWLAHTLACVPYVLLGLAEPYRRFNPALQSVAYSLGRSRMAFLCRVKWPLLKAALVSGFAVGFAVSVAQYLPTLYLGTGRFATVSTEAVNLAAGGQRSLASAFAWLQWLLPVVVFAIAGAAGRPRKMPES